MSAGPDPAERLLRELRPEPRAEFVRELEASLHARTRVRQRMRVLGAGAALCGFLTALVLIFSVAGMVPWDRSGADPGEAKSRCRTVVVTRYERRPVLVVDSDGRIRTENRAQTVRMPVRRCR